MRKPASQQRGGVAGTTTHVDDVSGLARRKVLEKLSGRRLEGVGNEANRSRARAESPNA
jgi:hypothetical protein